MCPRVNYPLCEDGSLLAHFTVFDYILLWRGHTISIRQLVGQFLRPRNMDELDVGVHAFFSVCRKHRLSTLTRSGLHWLLYSGQRRCEVMLKNIESDASDIAIGSHINRYDNGVLEHTPAMALGGKEVFENSYDVNLLDMTPAISAKLFKKGFLLKNNIRFAEGIPAQDLVFLEEALLNSKKVTVLNNQYIYYRNIHKKSISYNITERYLFGMIKAYSALFDLFEMFKIEYNIQKAIFKRHLGFFTTQILRAKNLNILTDEKLEKILNSQEFSTLTGKSAFDKLQIIQYFEFMRGGKYRDAQRIIRSINVNEINYLSLKEEKESLIKKIDVINEHNTTLTEQNNTINNKLIELQKDINSIESKTNDLTKENKYLQSENTNLKNELNEIKSKRLWKLLNRI